MISTFPCRRGLPCHLWCRTLCCS